VLAVTDKEFNVIGTKYIFQRKIGDGWKDFPTEEVASFGEASKLLGELIVDKPGYTWRVLRTATEVILATDPVIWAEVHD
jgi:hypothetical protein